jgi:hypothetical protein
MNKSSFKTALLSFAAALLVPVAALAQGTAAGTNTANTAFTITTNLVPRPAPTRRQPPIHGYVSAVDTNAMTLTIGNSTFSISPKTRIAKPTGIAKLSDIKVGEYAVVVYAKDTDGSLKALGIRVTIHPPVKPRQPTDAMAPAPPNSGTPAMPATPAAQN